MSLLIDADTILSGIEQWLQLEQQWGTPIDLDESTLEDIAEDPTMKTAFSSLDLLKKSTFDSSYVFKKSNRQGQYASQKSVDYKDFLEDLESPRKKKPFFFISGEILSAASVEEICEDIDDIFHSVEKLCSATSTVRFVPPKRKQSVHDVVQCSISTGGLSFDDTVADPSGKETEDTSIDRYIDEVFHHLHSTLASLSNGTLDKSTKETVTSLVKKFTRILKSPVMRSPKLRRQCGDKFRDLAAFWQGQADNCN